MILSPQHTHTKYQYLVGSEFWYPRVISLIPILMLIIDTMHSPLQESNTGVWPVHLPGFWNLSIGSYVHGFLSLRTSTSGPLCNPSCSSNTTLTWVLILGEAEFTCSIMAIGWTASQAHPTAIFMMRPWCTSLKNFGNDLMDSLTISKWGRCVCHS